MAYELIYFACHGKASPIRFALEDNGVEYKATMYTKEEWPAVKASTPFGQVPVLVYNGTKIAQSKTILHFVCGRLNLMGSDDVEKAVIEMYIEQAYDCRVFLVIMLNNNFEKGLEPFIQNIPKMLEPFEAKLSEGKGEYLVNDKLSAADYCLFDLLLIFRALRTESIDNSKKCKEFFTKFGARPKLRAYLDRPDIKEYVFTGSGRL